VIPAQCCTSSQSDACQAVGRRAFTTAAMKCARPCKGSVRTAKGKVRMSPACKQCSTEAAETAVRSFETCVKGCTSSETTLFSWQSREHHYAILSDDVSCDSGKVSACADKHGRNLAICLAGALGGCLLSGPAFEACLAIAWATCFATSYNEVFSECDPCPSGTSCTAVDVCCGKFTIGCPCASGATTGCCIDPRADLDNCGDCGVICTGVSPACCSGICADLDNDFSNCGACDHSCGFSGTVCCSGTCCLADSCCSGKCVDLKTDSSNCGICGVPCPAGVPCVDGVCSPSPSGSSS
jgi:hypothetical protein